MNKEKVLAGFYEDLIRHFSLKISHKKVYLLPVLVHIKGHFRIFRLMMYMLTRMIEAYTFHIVSRKYYSIISRPYLRKRSFSDWKIDRQRVSKDFFHFNGNVPCSQNRIDVFPCSRRKIVIVPLFPTQKVACSPVPQNPYKALLIRYAEMRTRFGLFEDE